MPSLERRRPRVWGFASRNLFDCAVVRCATPRKQDRLAAAHRTIEASRRSSSTLRIGALFCLCERDADVSRVANFEIEMRPGRLGRLGGCCNVPENSIANCKMAVACSQDRHCRSVLLLVL